MHKINCRLFESGKSSSHAEKFSSRNAMQELPAFKKVQQVHFLWCLLEAWHNYLLVHIECDADERLQLLLKLWPIHQGHPVKPWPHLWREHLGNWFSYISVHFPLWIFRMAFDDVFTFCHLFKNPKPSASRQRSKSQNLCYQGFFSLVYIFFECHTGIHYFSFLYLVLVWLWCFPHMISMFLYSNQDLWLIHPKISLLRDPKQSFL